MRPVEIGLWGKARKDADSKQTVPLDLEMAARKRPLENVLLMEGIHR